MVFEGMTGGLSSTTVLFADVAGSTGVYERLGNEMAHAHIQDALFRVRDIVVQAGGVVIKTIGDELMCCFASPPDALRAACEIQTGVRAASGPMPRLFFRIGLHSGEAISKDNDLFGDAVNTASRLVAMAKAGQILTSRETLSLCPDLPGERARDIGPVSVKGKRRPVQCVEVIWKDEKELTRNVGGPEPAPGRMILSFGTESFVVDDARPLVSVGRDPDNDIVAGSSLVSSTHAVIERRRDKFFLRDQSTNGCLVLASDRPQLSVHREEVVLFGEGIIVVGGAPPEPDRSIRFQSVAM